MTCQTDSDSRTINYSSNMKAQTAVCANRVAEFALLADGFKISKPGKETNDAEMQTCFLKLKELVPTIPQNRRLSKVALLQHVIDYILDLETTLEFHPAVINTTPQPKTQSTVERKPLAEHNQALQEVNTLLHNTLQTSHLQKPEVSDCDSRPSSC